jgi:hypothetical protein
VQGGATGDVAGLLIRAINARSTAERPSIAELSGALKAANGSARRAGVPQPATRDTGGVKDWKPLTLKPNVTMHPRQTGPKVAAQSPLGTPSGRTRRTSVPSSASSSGSYRPSGPRNIPPPAQPSSGVVVLISAAIIVILIIVVLIIVV